MSMTVEPRAAKVNSASAAGDTYERDFYAWTQQQAALLREGRFGDLDVKNLIEEIESLGRSEKRELESRLKVLLMHFLKWQFQADRRERHARSWLATIRNQRTELRKLIRDNPSLKGHLEAAFIEAYQDARYEAEAGLPLSAFPESSPYRIEQILDPLWMPERLRP